MAISAEDKNFLVSLYVGYFNRAPDPAGLQFWIDQVEAGRDTNTIAADFAASPEAKSLYPFLTTPDVSSPTSFITAVYANLFNRAPDAAGQAFWEAQLSSGAVSPADAIDAIIKGATTAPDSTVLSNKITVGLDFATDAGNTPGFTFDLNGASGNAAKNAISGVTEDAATVTAAQAATDAYLSGASNPGQSFTLTAGVDDINGTAANDTITATNTTAAPVLGSLDNVDGGAGTDTFQIADTATAANADFALPTGISISNVETLEIVTNGDLDAGAGRFDVSGFAGLTTFKGTSAGDGDSEIQAADTTDVDLTVGGTSKADVLGGKAITVNGGTGTTTVAGNALTTVSVKDGGAVDIDNTKGGVTSTGTTMTAVALEDIAGATAAIKGAAITNVTVKDQDTALATTVTNGTSKSLTIGLDDAGIDAAGAAVAGVAFTAGAAAETVTFDTATKSDVDLNTSAALKTVTFTGAGDLNLGGLGAIAGITTIDGSAATGGLTLGALNAAAVTVTTGAGKDSFTVTATDKATVNSGAGDDTVTLNSTLNKDTTVTLGEGNDTVLNGAAPGVVSSTNTIDAGAGTDTLALTLVGAANVAAFKNFETFDAVGLDATLDTAILTANNTVTEFVASGAVGAKASLTNVATGVGVRVTGDMNVSGNAALALDITQATAGTLKITHDADETATTAQTTAADAVSGNVKAINATALDVVFDTTFVGDPVNTTGDNFALLRVEADKATTLTINSGGNAATNDIDVTGGDDATAGKGDLLTSVTVTGSQKLDFGYTASAGIGGGTEITTFDASASTGGLIINLDAIKDTNTVTLGSGDDSITAQAVALSDAAAIAEHVKLANFESGSAEDLALATGLDTITFQGAVNEVQAADNAAGNADASVVNGKITFKGAGPATLTEAVADVQGLIGANEVAVFEYVGNSYIFSEGADGDGGDTLVELTGVTGVNGIDEVGTTDAFYIF